MDSFTKKSEKKEGMTMVSTGWRWGGRAHIKRMEEGKDTQTAQPNTVNCLAWAYLSVACSGTSFVFDCIIYFIDPLPSPSPPATSVRRLLVLPLFYFSLLALQSRSVRLPNLPLFLRIREEYFLIVFCFFLWFEVLVLIVSFSSYDLSAAIPTRRCLLKPLVLC